jgi:hypothetical protein
MSARDVLGDGWVKVIERASRLCTSQSLAHCRFASTAALSRIASAKSLRPSNSLPREKAGERSAGHGR